MACLIAFCIAPCSGSYCSVFVGLDCVCRIFNHISFTVSVTHVFLGLPTLLFGGSIGFKEPLCSVMFCIGLPSSRCMFFAVCLKGGFPTTEYHFLRGS